MGKVKRRRARTGDSDYEVGYGNPPRQSQFKAGQSGNPKGRPKGARNFKTDVNATLLTPVKVAREGRMRKISTQEAMLLRLREKALGGDARSLDRLIALAQVYSDEEPSVSMDPRRRLHHGWDASLPVPEGVKRHDRAHRVRSVRVLVLCSENQVLRRRLARAPPDSFNLQYFSLPVALQRVCHESR